VTDVIIAPLDQLEARTFAGLQNAGADEVSAGAATRAMLHASRLGIDSHGVRLTPHYARVLRSGRVNPTPKMQIRRTAIGSAVLDADNGLGHAAGYAAMELACSLAKEAGVGAVGVINSSHFGAAGAYALAGAEAGCIAVSMSNTDAIVGLQGGAERFHGTNPIAVGAPVPNQKPCFWTWQPRRSLSITCSSTRPWAGLCPRVSLPINQASRPKILPLSRC
jgi:ureidoglycolate dehydrogenase (NAD+)